ncbi:hypothetical protein ACJ41O_009690 [Fusarium nematophilum]
MPCLSSVILLIDLWPLPEGNDTWTDSPSLVKRQNQSAGSRRVTAYFESQRHNGVISEQLLESLLGKHFDRCAGKPAFVAIYWSFPGSDRDCEVSHLEVASGLEHDLIIPKHSSPSSWNSPITQAEPYHPPLPIDESVSNTEASGAVATEDCTAQHWRDISFEDKLADHEFVKSLAESQGIVLMNLKSVQDFASLLLRLYKKSLNGNDPPASPPQPGGAAPRMDSKEASGSVRGSNSSVPDSHSDGSDLDCTWSAVSSERAPYARFPEPASPRSPSQASEQTYAGESTRARQSVASASREDSSNSSWFVLGNSPRNSAIENASPRAPSEEAFWEEQGPSPSQTDFEMHPGHKFWVWDGERERWRRRGRSGLEERDWFPESLA